MRFSKDCIRVLLKINSFLVLHLSAVLFSLCSIYFCRSYNVVTFACSMDFLFYFYSGFSLLFVQFWNRLSYSYHVFYFSSPSGSFDIANSIDLFSYQLIFSCKFFFLLVSLIRLWTRRCFCLQGLMSIISTSSSKSGIHLIDFWL